MGAVVSSAVEMVLTDESWEPVTRYAIDVRDESVCAFAGRQVHIVTEHCGHLDPLDLDEYAAHDGFAALRALLESDPRNMIDTIDSGRASRARWGGLSHGWQVGGGPPGRERHEVRRMQRR